MVETYHGYEYYPFYEYSPYEYSVPNVTIKYPYYVEWTNTTPQGWECPKCHHIFGPHVDECKYCGQKPLITYGPLGLASE